MKAGITLNLILSREQSGHEESIDGWCLLSVTCAVNAGWFFL